MNSSLPMDELKAVKNSRLPFGVSALGNEKPCPGSMSSTVNGALRSSKYRSS
jgi:hypothetical protein